MSNGRDYHTRHLRQGSSQRRTINPDLITIHDVADALIAVFREALCSGELDFQVILDVWMDGRRVQTNVLDARTMRVASVPEAVVLRMLEAQKALVGRPIAVESDAQCPHCGGPLGGEPRVVRRTT